MSRHLELLERMILIRAVEEAIAQRYAEQEMRCPTHLSIGQEAPAAAAGLCLRTGDYMVSTHRGHAHYLACGGNLDQMIAEIYGKVTGCARGRGGSMHLVDMSAGFVGTTAIVGNSIPIGIGLGKAIQLDGTDGVACIFLGDAAIETGSFYECANFAATANLPILFLCENNLYSVYTGLSARQPEGRSIYKLASAIGLKSWNGDGNDGEEALNLIDEAVATIRHGEGPCFVELSTYRWREHCGPNFDNDLGYRTAEEFETWRKRDPIALLEGRLIRSQDDIDHMIEYRNELASRVDRAFELARSAPFPPIFEAYADEYAGRLE